MKIKEIFTWLLVLASLGYIGFAAYILNSQPEQILESQAATEKNKLQGEIREAYSTKTKP
jgi:hypothetical protein